MFGSAINREIVALVALTGAWVSIGLAQSADSTPTGGSELLTNLSPVTNAMLLEPPAEDWLLWRQSYDSHGFSSLDQITSENAAELELAWKIPLAPGPNMATPLVHDGVMFLASTEDTVSGPGRQNRYRTVAICAYSHNTIGSWRWYPAGESWPRAIR